MELLNPRVTVENADHGFWLVRMEHRLSDVEHIDIRFKVPRGPRMTLAGAQREALLQLRNLVETLLDDPSSTPKRRVRSGSKG